MNGKLVKRTTGATPTLGVRTGRFQIVAVDAAGNLSKDSIAVVVARGTGKGHPYTTAR